MGYDALMRLDSRKPSMVVAMAVVTTAVLASAPARADTSALSATSSELGELETARLSAMGGAQRATATGTTSILVNPATLPVLRVYQVSAVTQNHAREEPVARRRHRGRLGNLAARRFIFH